MTGPVPDLSTRLAAAWGDFIVALRSNEGFQDDLYTALVRVLRDCAPGWWQVHAIPKLGANILVEIVPATQAAAEAYAEPVRTRVLDASFELYDLVIECFATTRGDGGPTHTGYPTASAMSAVGWRNYLMAQLASASLGAIPRHALAVGVEPGDDALTVHFQLTEVDEQDEENMAEIVDEFAILLGDVALVRKAVDVRPVRHVNPFQGILWTYTARWEPGPDDEDD